MLETCEVTDVVCRFVGDVVLGLVAVVVVVGTVVVVGGGGLGAPGGGGTPRIGSSEPTAVSVVFACCCGVPDGATPMLTEASFASASACLQPAPLIGALVEINASRMPPC